MNEGSEKRVSKNSVPVASGRILWYWLPDTLVFAAACSLFGLFWAFRISTDIQLHASYVIDLSRGAVPPPANFLYYLLVYMFGSIGGRSWGALGLASSLLLGAAVAAKFSVTRRILGGEKGVAPTPARSSASAAGTALLLSLALLLVFSLPMRPLFSKGYFYLGQIPPNIWHNSTTIFLMPFALLLFWVSYRQLLEPGNRKGMCLLFLLALNLFTKPSFIFPFVAVYPLFMLKRTLRGGGPGLFFANMLPVALAGMLTLGMYVLIYTFSFGTTHAVHAGKSGVAIAPLFVWRHFSPDVALSFLLSALFPMAYLLLYPEERKNLLMHYSWALYCIAVLIFALFAETGPRALHGNFFWQAPVCAYLLFFATCLRFGRRLLAEGLRNWKNAALALCLSAHVASGAAYLAWIFVCRTIF